MPILRFNTPKFITEGFSFAIEIIYNLLKRLV